MIEPKKRVVPPVAEKGISNKDILNAIAIIKRATFPCPDCDWMACEFHEMLNKLENVG